MSRRNTPKLDTTVQARLPVAERKALDDWRRQQQEIPSRPEAIREAIRHLVAASRAETRLQGCGMTESATTSETIRPAGSAELRS
jgi:hypothetical protein